WGFFKNRAPKSYNVLLYFSGAVFCGALLFYTLPDIFLYPTEFLMMGESAFSTDFLFKLIGYSAGLLLVFLAGLFLFKAGINLSGKTYMILLTISVGVNAVNQILKVTQSLYAQRIIPTSRFLFNILKQAVNYNDYFLYMIMAVTFLIPAVLWLKNRNQKEPYANPAEHRKIKASLRSKRRWSVAVIFGYALAVLCLTVVKTYEAREVVLSPIEPMNIIGDEIIIPSANIMDGHLHRFMYTASDGTGVRFIVIKKNETTYGVGLDACDICGPTGYYERKDEIICKLCDVVMNKATIGFKGGCNPVPLAYTMESGNMVIQTAHLEKEKGRFK
ncbi:MAG: Fe-S-containing protein, partial [Syntrophomonadaceae bacterium]|nr:Fe-S-containing protein [Syntrophomonadaceae bacterium]